MRRLKVKLNNRLRAVTWGGQTTVLQEKSWQVLSILIAGECEIVTRKHIIDTVWQGNYLTGEKGLNQAVWAIRTAPGKPREKLPSTLASISIRSGANEWRSK